MQSAREVLAWALCSVAQGKNEWLDLETFLCDLWSATGEDIIQFYWSDYAWSPNFASAKSKHETTGDKSRRRAFWLDREGTWAANAILGTLYYLGLVERGRCGSGGASSGTARASKGSRAAPVPSRVCSAASGCSASSSGSPAQSR